MTVAMATVNQKHAPRPSPRHLTNAAPVRVRDSWATIVWRQQSKWVRRIFHTLHMIQKKKKKPNQTLIQMWLLRPNVTE